MNKRSVQMKPGTYEFGAYQLVVKEIDSKVQYFIPDKEELQRISDPMIRSYGVSNTDSLLEGAESGVYTFYLWPQFRAAIAQVEDKYESATFTSPLVRSLIQCCFKDVLNKAETRWMMCCNMMMHCQYHNISTFILKDKDGNSYEFPITPSLEWFAPEEYFLYLVDTYEIQKKYLDW